MNLEQALNESRGEVKALRMLLDDERAKVAAFEADTETDDWLSHRHHEEWKRAEEAEAKLIAIRNVPSPTDLLTNAVARAMFEYAGGTVAVAAPSVSAEP